MASDGAVSRAEVIRVLRKHGVRVTDASASHGADKYIIESASGEIEVQTLEADVSKRMLQRFQRTYGVAIHTFYNPHLVPEKKADEEATKQPPIQ